MSEINTPQTPDSNLTSNSDRLKEEIAHLTSDFLEESSTLDLNPSHQLSSDSPEIDSESVFQETPENAPESFAQETNWFLLARKQRQRNRELIQQVATLELALAESQEELQGQVRQCQSTEILMNEQAEELKSAQNQITRLFQELESSHQAAQRQQILIETLSEQLETSQERIAQLERECALVQQQYNEQSQKTLQAEAINEDLRARLRRQERQTMQFKAALDKYLEVTAYGSRDASLDTPRTAKSPFAEKPKPIQPWSASTEFLSQTFPEEVTVPSHSSPTPIEEKVAEKEISSPLVPEAELPEISSPIISEENSPSEPLSSVPSSTNDESAEEILTELEAAVKAPEETSFTLNQDISSIPEVEEDQEDSEEEWVRKAEEIQRVMSPQVNWPSPLLYPLRNGKKRKSKSSIDLPRFPSH